MSTSQSPVDPQQPVRGPSWPRLVLVGTVVGLMMCGSPVILMSRATGASTPMSILLGLVFLLVSSREIVRRLIVWTRSSFLPGMCALAVTATTPFLVWILRVWFRRVLVSIDNRALPLEMKLSGVVVALAALSFLVVLGLAARAQAKGFGRVLVYLSRGFALLGTALVVALLVSADPPADAQSSLASAGNQKFVGVIKEVWKSDGALEIGELIEFRYTVGDVTVVKHCTSTDAVDSCKLGIVDGADARPSPDDVPSDAFTLLADERFELWRGLGETVLFLRPAGHWGRLALL